MKLDLNKEDENIIAIALMSQFIRDRETLYKNKLCEVNIPIPSNKFLYKRMKTIEKILSENNIEIPLFEDLGLYD